VPAVCRTVAAVALPRRGSSRPHKSRPRPTAVGELLGRPLPSAHEADFAPTMALARGQRDVTGCTRKPTEALFAPISPSGC
jgi:hypothetical protein